MDFDFYIQLTDKFIKEFQDVRETLEKAQADVVAGKCHPIITNPPPGSTCDPGITSLELGPLEREYQKWFREMRDRLPEFPVVPGEIS